MPKAPVRGNLSLHSLKLLTAKEAIVQKLQSYIAGTSAKISIVYRQALAE